VWAECVGEVIFEVRVIEHHHQQGGVLLEQRVPQKCEVRQHLREQARACLRGKAMGIHGRLCHRESHLLQAGKLCREQSADSLEGEELCHGLADLLSSHRP